MNDEELEALAKQKEQEAGRPKSADEVIEEIVCHIHRSINAAYKDVPDVKFHVDEIAIKTALENCFFIGKGKWLFMLGPGGVPVVFTGKDAHEQLRKRFGNPVRKVDPPPATAVQRGAVYNTPITHLFDAIKYYNQRQVIWQMTDMFATGSKVSLTDPIAAQIVLAHRELSVDAEPDPEVIADYKEHFPEFDDLLDAITAAKFAPDRKEAYLWLHCVSDWGKGFLIGVFRKLGIVTEISVSEAEKAFTGAPVALSEMDFYNKFLVAFDEFKNVKAELKQLQNYIMLSPKNQLRVECQLYFKIFFSKEAVHSLAGDRGIDEQFANRFALIRGKLTITSRDVFNRKGKGHYLLAVAYYAAERINERIEEYRDKGREKAERKASEALTWFHEHYGIDKHYDRSSISFQEIADEFGAWLADGADGDNCMDQKERVVLRENVFKGEDGNYYLKSAAGVFKHWAKNRIDPSEFKKVTMADDEVFVKLSADGEGSKQRKVAKGLGYRAVWLKPVYRTASGEERAFGKF